MSLIGMYVWSSFFIPPHWLFQMSIIQQSPRFCFVFFVLYFIFFLFAQLSRERNHGTWGRKGGEKREEKERAAGLQTAFDMCPGSLGPPPRSVGCAVVRSRQRKWREEGRGGSMSGLLSGSKVEGSQGSKGGGLALGIFAALSLPLSTLAHLHLCQLDVPQHVGVCKRETERVTSFTWITAFLFVSRDKSVIWFLH